MPSATTIIALGLTVEGSAPVPTFQPLTGFLGMLPLPWRKITPLHKQLGARSLRFVYPAAVAVPPSASPQVVNFRYDASSGMDRIIGFTLSVGNGGNASQFLLQELNTGWFLSLALGTTGALYQALIETMPDEVNLQFSFSTNVGAPVYISFQNIETVPHKIS